MNEESKNIETCLAENILAEVASVTQDPQFRSLVEESLDPLKQQALQQAGYEAYKEVVMYHQPYTFTSQVKQMKSNLILLLRRLWRFPFGRGTIRSLADMWQHYITRLQGNETYGIPSRLSQLTDLPSAPSLLSDRIISEPNAIDGISLANLLCGSYASLEEIADNNSGYDAIAAKMNTMVGIFPNLTKLTFRAKRILAESDMGGIISRSTFAELNLPNLEYFGNAESVWTNYFKCCLLSGTAVTKVTMPVLNTIRFAQYNGYADRSAMFNGCSQLVEIDAPSLTTTRRSDFGANESCALAANCSSLKIVRTNIEDAGASTGGYYGGLLVNCPALETLIVGKIKYTATSYNILKDRDGDSNMPNLIHLEIGEGTDVSLNFSRWNPTTALSDNLQQFLSNFRSFIILRLANRKSTTALTLTLSAAVYNAVTGADSGWASLHTLAELGITDNDLTELETELGITTATIYATWLDTYTGANGIHWNVNKAN